MKVAILICDGGDGSACLRWFKNIPLAEGLAASEEEEQEDFYMNEGSPTIIEVNEDFIPPTYNGQFDDHSYRDFEYE